VSTVSCALPEPAIDEGLNEQLAPLGSPLQESATVPLNPLIGVMVAVEVAALPATTEDGDSAAAAIWKSGGAPEVEGAPPPQASKLASKPAATTSRI
jgi:hypothetical protein